MIERLLVGEAALARNDLDAAERLFRQVAEADPRNAIAVAALARVALHRGDRDGARALAEQALGIDPEEADASRLLAQLDRPALPEPAPAPIQAAPRTIQAAPRKPAPSRGWRSWLARLLRRD